jgi:hypothetical protein
LDEEEEEAGEKEGRAESRVKSSRDAGSEGEVILSPVVVLVVVSVVVISSDCRVGRLGVDLLWKRDGTCTCRPLLCGGICLSLFCFL